MANYCSNCGRPLKEGEPCDCMSAVQDTAYMYFNKKIDHQTLADMLSPDLSRVERIQRVRNYFGIGLKDAMQFVDSFPVPDTTAQTSSNTEPELINTGAVHIGAAAGTSSAKEKVQTTAPLKKKIGTVLIAFALILAAIGIVMSLFGSKSPSDDVYIKCAETLVSKELKSPATAIYSNEKVVEKDSYDRALVTLSVDAQNRFGGYIRTNYVVILQSADKDGKFDYIPAYATESYSQSNDYLQDTIVNEMKENNKWNTPSEKK